jgi:UDP-2-acetamido-3-amino-2,3-dideoxy-glucuronate N-acetyltransferase
MRKPTIAIIGVGRWGKKLLTTFAEYGTVVAACHQGSPETTQWLAQEFPHLRTTINVQEILGDPSIRIVVIATPIAIHFTLTRAALLAGKDVFVEKPLTTNAREARTLVTLAAKVQRIVNVGHVFCHHEAVSKIQSLVKNDPITHADFLWNKWGTFQESLLWNLTCHDIALATLLMGTPRTITRVHAWGVVTKEDIATIRLTFPAGREALITNRIALPRESAGGTKQKIVTLRTKSGKLLIWDEDSIYTRNNATESTTTLFTAQTPALVSEVRTFLRCVETRKQPITDAAFGSAVVAAVERLMQ